MTIFRVPGDFPSIQLAMDSPLVQRGDTILVKKGAYNQVVVVPFNKVGIRVMGDGEPAIEQTAQVPGTDEPDASGTPEGADGTAQFEPEVPEPPGEAPVDPPAPEPVNPATPVTRSSVKMVKVERGSPYWVTVHRRELTPEKRWNPFLWMRFR